MDKRQATEVAIAAHVLNRMLEGTVKLLPWVKQVARSRQRPIDSHAAAATPLMSAHIWNARSLAARYPLAVTWSRRRWKRLAIWS